MEEGYVRVYRKMLDSAVMDDDWLCRLWMWCLLRANWKDGVFQGRPVKAGSFIFGRNTSAAQLNVSPSKLYRGLQRLAELNQITLEANSKWTTVSLCKWATYQNGQVAERTANEQQVNSGRTANEQQMNSQRTANEQPADTIEEFKNLRMQEGNQENRESGNVQKIGDSGETCEAQVPPTSPQRVVAAEKPSEQMTADQAAAIAAKATAEAKRLKGEEKKRDREAKRAADKAAAEAARIAEDRDYAVRIGQVVAHYRTHHPRSFLNGLTPDAREWAPILARLRSGFTVEDLCDAIDGCHVTPHNCGQNENGQKWQGLELIMRTNDHVTRFIESLSLYESGTPLLTQKNQRTLAAAKAFAQDSGGFNAGEGQGPVCEGAVGSGDDIQDGDRPDND